MSLPTRGATIAAVVALSFALPAPASALAAPDVSGKVVLANLDRYDAVLKVGSLRREIKPKKASVLTPKSYPVTVEYWSGNTKSGWQKQAISEAGIYGFNFQRGYWKLAKLQKGRTARPQRPTSRIAVRQRIVQPVRRYPINADRRRWPPLARAAWFAGSLYQFIRDEQDRDLLRHLLIHGREKDWADFERWLRDSDKIALPHKEELLDAMDELSRLSDEDWHQIETADEKDWEQARADLGDLISEDDWKDISADLADVDTGDYWQDDVELDFDELDFSENIDLEGNLDLDADFDLAEDFSVDDLGIDTGHYDLGGYDDLGGFDGAFDVDPGDFGGGDAFFGDDDFGDFGGFDDFDF